MRFLEPGDVTRLADAIGPAYRALVLVGSYVGGALVKCPERPQLDLTRGQPPLLNLSTM